MTSTLNRVSALLALCAAPIFAHAGILGVSFSGAVFDVNPGTGAATQLAASGPSFNSLASDGAAYWSVEAFGGRLSTIDPTTGAATLGPALTGLADETSIRGMAYFGGSLYAIQNTGGATSIGLDSLYRVDPITGAATFVGATGVTGLQALAADSSGELYGWDVDFGLMKINSATGVATDVSASVGGSSDTVQALAFSGTGVLYGARNSLYTIDTATGTLTLVGAISGSPDIRGIEFIAAVPEPEIYAMLLAGLGLLGAAAARRRTIA